MPPHGPHGPHGPHDPAEQLPWSELLAALRRSALHAIVGAKDCRSCRLLTRAGCGGGPDARHWASIGWRAYYADVLAHAMRMGTWRTAVAAVRTPQWDDDVAGIAPTTRHDPCPAWRLGDIRQLNHWLGMATAARIRPQDAAAGSGVP